MNLSYDQTNASGRELIAFVAEIVAEIEQSEDADFIGEMMEKMFIDSHDPTIDPIVAATLDTGCTCLALRLEELVEKGVI